MSLDPLIINYGYPILFVGVMLEGETFLIMAAFLVHRGYLNLPGVMLVAFLGTFAIDQFFFLLGRTKGSTFLAKRPAWQPGVSKVHGLLERYNLLLIIGFRFLYGLRTVTPFVIGMSCFPAKQFLLLNVIGGVAWTVVIALAGYAFGQVIEVVLGDVEKYELWILLGFAVVGSTLWLCHLYKRKLEGQPGL